MNNDELSEADDDFARVMAACDEQAASGEETDIPAAASISPELRARLERNLALTRLLRQALSPSGTRDAPGSTLDLATARTQVPSQQLPCARLGRFTILRELG